MEMMTADVGILIHKQITLNIKRMKVVSEISQVNKNTSLKVIQVAPTTEHDDEDVDTYDEQIPECLHEDITNSTIIGVNQNGGIGEYLLHKQKKFEMNLALT